MLRYYTTIIILVLSFSVFGQATLSLEDVCKNYTYEAETAPGFRFLKDGKHYSDLTAAGIEQFDITTGEKVKTIMAFENIKSLGVETTVEDYEFSADEKQILLTTQSQPVYRHSTRAVNFLYNTENQTIERLFDGRISNATFSPDGKLVAFVFENNLYSYAIATKALTQLTLDGAENEIINGMADWVYEEEIGFTKAFYWSPDSKKIAYYKFDEREVPEFLMKYHINEAYPVPVRFKYPKVGYPNAKVSIHVHTLSTGNEKLIRHEGGTDFYIPKVVWTNDPDKLILTKLNRHQNHLKVFLADVNTGSASLIQSEKDDRYVDVGDMFFTEDGKHFFWLKEEDGWNHLYYYTLEGKLVKQLTKGNWEITKAYGYDEKRNVFYFQAATDSPLEREVYKVAVPSGKMSPVFDQKGWTEIQFSSTYDFYVADYSSAQTPNVIKVYTNEGKALRTLVDNADLVSKMKALTISDTEFFEFETSENVTLNGWMLKPEGFDASKTYPLLMFVYGGPGSQTVMNRWAPRNFWYFQYLTKQGYVVASVDNRGTGGRGEDFRKVTYLQLGKYETLDQIESAKYLGSLPYIDSKHIGIFGWSYGGYMSSLCILKGSDVFNSAIAVAPVTNWKWYDTIYTERYMRTMKENREGYESNSPIYFADKLKGNYLLMHGMADDNVHFQHAVEMAEALIRADKQFDTYFYPNRNHGIYGRNARHHLFTKLTNFLDEHLKPTKS